MTAAQLEAIVLDVLAFANGGDRTGGLPGLHPHADVRSYGARWTYDAEGHTA
jgi:hypothetical protein